MSVKLTKNLLGYRVGARGWIRKRFPSRNQIVVRMFDNRIITLYKGEWR